MDDTLQRVSRRRFLGILAASAVGAACVAWLLNVPKRATARVRALFGGGLRPALRGSAPGALSDDALGVLQATTLVLVDTPVELGHYSAFFRWRAEKLRGYRDLYEEFAAALDQRAMRSAQRRFVDCDRAVQRSVLAKVDLDAHGIRAAVRVVFDRQWLRFEEYIVRQILSLFARTDGWVLLGYDAWPGMPRGLEGYTRPPKRRPT